MSVCKQGKGVYVVRWREGDRHRSLKVHGTEEFARKVEREKLCLRDENRYPDISKEINYRMSELIDRYWVQYGVKKASAGRERSILGGHRFRVGIHVCTKRGRHSHPTLVR